MPRRGRCSPASRPPSSVQPPLTEALRPSPQISSAAAAASLAQGIRLFGHRAAQLDPLGSESPGDPQLDYAAHGLSDANLQSLPAGIIGGPVVRAAGIETAADAIQRLERIYCSTSGFEFAHVGDPSERLWLLQAVEEERFRPPQRSSRRT